MSPRSAALDDCLEGAFPDKIEAIFNRRHRVYSTGRRGARRALRFHAPVLLTLNYGGHVRDVTRVVRSEGRYCLSSWKWLIVHARVDAALGGSQFEI